MNNNQRLNKSGLVKAFLTVGGTLGLSAFFYFSLNNRNNNESYIKYYADPVAAHDYIEQSPLPHNSKQDLHNRVDKAGMVGVQCHDTALTKKKICEGAADLYWKVKPGVPEDEPLPIH